MRAALLILLVIVSAVFALVHPWIGVMAWTVISVMNPHRYAWSAANLPVAATVAIATLIGIVFTRDRVRMVISPVTLALLAFMIWICVTLPFSFAVEPSFEMWKRVMKIDFMILVAVAVLHTRKHVMVLASVLVASIGIYGFKGGIFTIASGGVYRVWGPPDSFIEGNNEIGLAIIMTIPLMRFLQLQARSRWTKHGLTLLMILSAIAAVGTQSRGALLAIVAMAVMMWWRAPGKLALGALIGLAAWGLTAFMPQQWDARMSTIIDYEHDSSAMGRLNAWQMAFNLAKDRLFGGGFEIYNAEVFSTYAPVPNDVHAAHSIYFQILGEHGFVGLALFLLLWMLAWRTAGWLRRNAPRQPESKWAADLGATCHASMAAYAVGGAFLSLAYFDLPYNLLVLLVVTRRWIEEKGWERDAAGVRAAMPEPSLSIPTGS
jgi:probable O-glycosylation ligase (exosortase A-associated)